ncbi:hypothetical protein [Agrobacterium tumefaciens]|uniref:hypothetical protein n=1 Tax=Agrobacterium tumefaciens TaxID=358 RepID=UPI001574BCCC|nr:hypothetical protein [Agrobacterium tumefaciens]WCK68982.1 hypothetical protein G6L23_023090 [Agrobacterium tumefaciens]
MEDKIAVFMLRVAKFEFFLMNADLSFAHVETITGIVKGLNWTRLAQRVEEAQPFAKFDFDNSPIRLFKETSPQYLVMGPEGRLKWDSDDEVIQSWDRLLNRSFAQLRNNIAHGSKGLLSAPFTHDRTEQFLIAGHVLIDFIAVRVLGYPDWERPISFR